VFAKNAGQARNIAYVWIKHWESETPLGNCDHTFIDFPIAREKRIDDLRPGYISAYGGVVDIEDKLFRWLVQNIWIMMSIKIFMFSGL